MTRLLTLLKRRHAAFTPASLPGLVLWLKADAITGLNDGDAIDTWTDSSANGNNATGTTTTRPIYKTNIVNSKPVVRFDGTDDKLQITDNNTLDLTGDQSIFVVVDYNGTKGALIAHYNNSAGFAGWGFDIGVAVNNGKPCYYSNTKGSRQENATALSTTGFHLVAITRASGTVQFYIDGTAGTTLTGHGNTAASDPVWIGILPDGVSPLNGDIAEIVVSSTALSGANLTNFKTYIATKYGLTIA